jgi:uncharacterized protein (TIGR04255 family)
MPFPESPRVIYTKNPLKLVACQLHFPSILRIESEPPSKFQDEIRTTYPLFQEIPRFDKEAFPAGLPPEITKHLAGLLPIRLKQTTYEFCSEDKKWIIALGRDFLSLTSSEYTSWDVFKSYFQAPLESLNKHYTPAFFSRVGLRYGDVIKKSELGLESKKWSDLLQPHIIGELATPKVSDRIREAFHEVVVQLEGEHDGFVCIRHGLATNDSRTATAESAEEEYRIDTDFFRDEKTETKDALHVLNYFNKKAGSLFRWCITDTLHAAMYPRNPE